MFGTFQVVPAVCVSLFTFSNSFFFILIWMDVYFFSFVSNHCFESLVSFLSLLVPCIFLFILLCTAFTFSSVLQPYLIISVSCLITSVLNSASESLAISSSISFFWSFDLFFHLGHISLSWCTCYVVRWRGLRYSPGRDNPLCCLLVLSVREGSERERWGSFALL